MMMSPKLHLARNSLGSDSLNYKISCMCCLQLSEILMIFKYDMICIYKLFVIFHPKRSLKTFTDDVVSIQINTNYDLSAKKKTK